MSHNIISYFSLAQQLRVNRPLIKIIHYPHDYKQADLFMLMKHLFFTIVHARKGTSEVYVYSHERKLCK